MGFYKINPNAITVNHSDELLHQLECKACPLNEIKANRNPHIPAQGATSPKVYILGEAPGADEDRNNTIFTGDSGELLRAHIPKEWIKHIRWNNVVRTRPPQNRDPTHTEIEACRPSVERDIIDSKPLAIFGFGAFPLHWVSKRDGIAMWRGRRFPVNIGGHECWYYAFVHPAWLYRMKNERRSMRPGDIGTEPERAFVFDLKRAFAEIDDLPEPVVHTQEVAEYGVEVIAGKKAGDLERLSKYLEWAKKQKVKGFDWETNAVRPYHKHAKILTAAVGTPDLSFSWAIDHQGAGWSKHQREKVIDLTIDFLQNDEGTKAVHALGFEQEWTGVILGRKLLRASRWDCTITQAHVIDERLNKNKGKKQGPLSLDWLCFQYFGISIKSISVLDRANLDNEPVEEVCRYNGIDGKYHCLLFMAQDEVIRRQGLLKQYRMMRRRVPTCVLTQIKGVPVNPKVTERLDKKYQLIIDEAKEQIAELPEVREFKKRYEATFNPLSGDDVELMLREILKRKEGFRIDRETKKEKYSTDEDVLKQINHPICPLLLKLRKANKRSSTYLYRELWPDGMLHSTFNTVFTETWRLSSNDPNLQNMPKRVEENKEVRAQIVAPPGHSFVAPDYGQIEACVIAMITKDPAFCKALWERYDVHGDEARRLALCYPKRIGGKKFIDDKEVMKKLRDAVKNKWTFPLFFGASLNRVSDEMEIPISDLESEYNRFQKTFSGVFDWHEELQAFYQKHGYVETLNGVRRRAPLSHNKVINTPVQGTAAEIVMDGMNRISELADDLDDWYLQPNIQIHDDLTFILPDNKIDHYAEKIITTMLDCPYDFINVPLTIKMSVGPDLLNMEEVLKASSDDWKVR